MDECVECLPDCCRTCQENGDLANFKQFLARKVLVSYSLYQQLKGKSEEEQLQIVRRVLPPHHVNKIENGFKIPTFKMTITQKNNKYHALFERDGKTFKEPLILLNSEAVLEASNTQLASVLMELFFLLYSCAGIKIELNARQTATIATEVGEDIAANGQIQAAIRQLVLKWKILTNDWQRAKEIFNLLVKLKAIGNIFYKVFKLTISGLSWLEK